MGGQAQGLEITALSREHVQSPAACPGDGLEVGGIMRDVSELLQNGSLFLLW